MTDTTHNTNSAAPVNYALDHLDSATAWIERQGRTGDMPSTSARLANTAIAQFRSTIRSDEPQSVSWFLENVDMLTTRFVNLNANVKGDTARTYAARARSALKEHARYCVNPGAYRSTSKAKAPREEKKVTKPTKQSATLAAQPASAPPAPVASMPLAPVAVGFPPGLRVRDLPLAGDDREFLFAVPKDFTRADWAKVAHHLATFVRDGSLQPEVVAETLARIPT